MTKPSHSANPVSKPAKLLHSNRIAKILLMGMGAGASLLLLLAGTVTVRLVIARQQAPEPEGILVLGGGTGREEFAAQFAHHHPKLDVWVSSGRYPEGPAIFRVAGVPPEQLHFEWYAQDTVGNFARHVKGLQERHIQHVYLITSDYHMPRAQVIATIIFGSRGIAVTPVIVPSTQAKESWGWLRISRDSFRAIVWAFTGYAGNRLTEIIKK
jgi:uncharacterized SAM-binding protein YcdF (DUF218 family)